MHIILRILLGPRINETRDEPGNFGGNLQLLPHVLFVDLFHLKTFPLHVVVVNDVYV